jgi:RNA polymerase subunit RPABC4/transcription elongation factor Spt4
MRHRNVAAVLLISLAAASMWITIASALPPLETGISFPAGTFVIPMDEKQAQRILVFGFVHALVRDPNPIVLFRVIEPPNVTLSTNMTASPAAFYGGPFLVYPSDSAKVTQVKNNPDFKYVTVGKLTTQHTLNNIFRVSVPTKILVVKGEPPWGRTDTTLDTMKIPYTLITHGNLTANPSIIFNYTMIVIDCNGWNGHIPTQIADDIRSHVQAGNEVIFTDRAIWDLNSTFPGYVTVSGVQPTDRISNAYAYNPPRKYDLTKYGASADRLDTEYPSQYYNLGSYANEIKVMTESQGIAVSSVPSGRVNDVRILSDSKNFGASGNEYAILAFYFEYGGGIVEGLAFHPQQQTTSVIGTNGYYAVYQFYGNKFVHGVPPGEFELEANPTSRTVYQGDSTTYTITVRSFSGFNLPVTLGVTGLPPGATAVFSPQSPQPPASGTAQSTLTVTVPKSAPIGNYALTITGTDTSSPPIQKQVIVTLNVLTILPDFSVCVSPNSLTINASESKTAIVTVTSSGGFNQNVTLNVYVLNGTQRTGLPAHVTATFTPPAPQPPAGGTADSIMRITVGADAVNDTYRLLIVGSSGTLERDTTTAPCSLQFFTLKIEKPIPPGIPWLTLLLIILAALAGVILGLLAYALSSRRGPTGPSGLKYVVPANAQRMRCPTCGNLIAVDAVYCPFCRRRRGTPVATGVVVVAAPPVVAYARRRVIPERRAIWGFVLAMIGGILILINSVALLSPTFWGAPTGWSNVFFWLGGSSGIGQPIAVLIGLISGLTVIAGGIMMVMRRGPIGAIITFPFAALSFIIGGGFIVGGILGIVAGILGMLRR